MKRLLTTTFATTNMKAIGTRPTRIVPLVATVLLLGSLTFSNGLVQPQQSQPSKPQSHDNETQESLSSSLSSNVVSRRTFGMATASLATVGSSMATPAHADIVDVLNTPIGSPDLVKGFVGEITGKPTIAKLVPYAVTQKIDNWQPPKLYTNLANERIQAKITTNEQASQSLFPIPNALPFASRDTLYPYQFIGDWVVTATLTQKTFPFGPDFVPNKILREGSPLSAKETVGDKTSYFARYTPVRVNGDEFGIADRAYNTLEASKSYAKSNEDYLVLSDKNSLQWDPKTDPTRLVYEKETLDKINARPILRVESTLTGRKAEDLSRTMMPESRVFAYTERTRVVTTTSDENSAPAIKTETVIPSSATAAANSKKKGKQKDDGPSYILVQEDDCEISTEYRNLGASTILGMSRIAVYLLPNQGALWSKVKGKAVAFYDYELLLQRNTVAAES